MVREDRRFLLLDHRDGNGRTVIRADGLIIRYDPPIHLGLTNPNVPIVTEETSNDELLELIGYLDLDQQNAVLHFFGRTQND